MSTASTEGRRALITGVTGQDGSYLSEHLLARGYQVHGMIRRASTPNTRNIAHLLDTPGFHVEVGDLADPFQLYRLLDRIRPHEVYNLAAQSRVDVSFHVPSQTLTTNALGTLHLLEAIRNIDPSARFYQASSSEMFGKVRQMPQNEDTPFHPRSPYGVSKVASFWTVVNYRESYGLFACNGILFNHESPRRGQAFVTRKIAMAVARIKRGLQPHLTLGNLDACRDWGFSPEYVDAMWRMLQADTPEDFVVATGESHSVQEFVEAAFSAVDLDWRQYVRQDPALFRPAEVEYLLGDATKAREKLGWTPTVTFAELVGIMVRAELDALD